MLIVTLSTTTWLDFISASRFSCPQTSGSCTNPVSSSTRVRMWTRPSNVASISGRTSRLLGRSSQKINES